MLTWKTGRRHATMRYWCWKGTQRFHLATITSSLEGWSRSRITFSPGEKTRENGSRVSACITLTSPKGSALWESCTRRQILCFPEGLESGLTYAPLKTTSIDIRMTMYSFQKPVESHLTSIKCMESVGLALLSECFQLMTRSSIFTSKRTGELVSAKISRKSSWTRMSRQSTSG